MSNGTSKSMPNAKNDETYYGVLNSRNIDQVQFGDYLFETWYGNAAYFSTHDHNHSELGYSYTNKVAHDPTFKARKKSLQQDNGSESFWLDKLLVCDYCFKYTAVETEMQIHRLCCPFNKSHPIIGKLLYRDDQTPYLIKEIRGFIDPLFCQNLSLFGKLFLDDKSVYYNIDYFNFYVVYGYDENDENQEEKHFKPMGFFSKEVLSYENNNNLACICIFPPFQRRGLGSLLIEFSYALARVTPGQFKSGPEFPLSPYGKVSYLRFWSKSLSNVIYNHMFHRTEFTIADLSDLTGYRKEDILLTLEYMKLLRQDTDNQISLMLGNFDQWCKQNKVDPSQQRSMLNPDCLLL